MQDTIHIKGLTALGKALSELPLKLERNVLRGALRAGQAPIRDHARENAAKATGELADGLRVSTSSKGGKVYATLRTGGKHGFIAPWIEFGTSAHMIKPRRPGGKLRLKDGRVVSSVVHPGSRAIPFMRPALDTQKNAAVLAVANYIRNRLATQHGIDMPAPRIEGDE